MFYVSSDSDILIFFDNFNLILNSVNERISDLLIVVGRDFNCRLAALNQLHPTMFTDCCKFSIQIYSTELMPNTRSKKLVNIMESCNYFSLNGRLTSNRPGNLTFIGLQGRSIIYLMWCSANSLFAFSDLKVLIWYQPSPTITH